MALNHAGDRDTLVYVKPDFVPATYTILNFQVDDIDAAVDGLTERGVSFERYDGFDQDEKGVMRGKGPADRLVQGPGREHPLGDRGDVGLPPLAGYVKLHRVLREGRLEAGQLLHGRQRAEGHVVDAVAALLDGDQAARAERSGGFAKQARHRPEALGGDAHPAKRIRRGRVLAG